VISFAFHASMASTSFSQPAAATCTGLGAQAPTCVSNALIFLIKAGGPKAQPQRRPVAQKFFDRPSLCRT
jgi:hypothetical protein